MGTQKATSRRMLAMAITALLCVAATALLLLGVTGGRYARNAQTNLSVAEQDIKAELPVIREEVARLRSRPGETSPARLGTLVGECQEEMHTVRRFFRSLLSDHKEYEEMREEWGQVVGGTATVVKLSQNVRFDPEARAGMEEALDKLEVDLETFARVFERSSHAAREAAEDRRYGAALSTHAALVVLILATAWSAMAFLLAATEAASAAQDVVDLPAEIAEAAAQGRTTARLQRLRAPGSPALPGDARWDLRLLRIVSERRTHIVFEALAVHGDEQIRLWCRRYNLLGRVKRIQRLFFPGYESAYWRALCTMRAAGLPGPMPLVHMRRRRGLFQTSGLILCEHLGELESVVSFLLGDLCLMPPEGRRRLVRRIVQFVAGCHRTGIFRIGRRYLHGRNLDDPEGGGEIFLLDLDKVLVWERCPRWIASLLSSIDRHRLEDLLRECLEPDEFAEARGLFRQIEQAGPAGVGTGKPEG